MLFISMKAFIDWLITEDSWKGFAAITYLLICIFDFIVVPIWIGTTRPTVSQILLESKGLETSLIIEAVRTVYSQHQPFTLQGGGLFHIAFGAILTGSVLKDRIGTSNK